MLGLAAEHESSADQSRRQVASASRPAAGQSNLYLYPLDEECGGRGGRGGGEADAEGRRGPAVDQHTRRMREACAHSPDSREVYLPGRRARRSHRHRNRQVRSVNVNAEMDIDFNKEKMAVFEEAWAGQRDNYYDPKYQRRRLERGAQDVSAADRRRAHAR